MKNTLWVTACAVLAGGMVARAGDVALRLVDSAGNSYGFYPPGAMIHLEVRAVVTPIAGEGGLALFGFDFEAPPGVPLASNQFTTTLTSFVKDEGLTNPAGFGGTLSGNKLLQVGGGQNTIGYAGTTPSYPTGTVVEGVGLTETTIARIDLDTFGVYGELAFQISNAFANLIDPASQPSAPPYTGSAANMLAGSPIYMVLIIPSPVDFEINDDVMSWKNHGTALGDLGLPIPLAPQLFAPIETRAGSVTTFTFSFGNAVDPATFGPAAITICGHVNSPPAPTSAWVVGNAATLNWAADAIPNGFQQLSVHDHYTVVIADTVRAYDGGKLIGDRDFDFVASFGNVRRENLGNWRAVNPLDRTLLTQNYTNNPTPAQAVVFDIRLDGGNAGRINPLDRTALVQSYTPSSAEWLIQAPPSCP